MKDIIGYECKHCNRSKGQHKAGTFNCIQKGKQNKISPVYVSTTYEPDENKPIYGFNL